MVGRRQASIQIRRSLLSLYSSPESSSVPHFCTIQPQTECKFNDTLFRGEETLGPIKDSFRKYIRQRILQGNERKGHNLQIMIGSPEEAAAVSFLQLK